MGESKYLKTEPKLVEVLKYKNDEEIEKIGAINLLVGKIFKINLMPLI